MSKMSTIIGNLTTPRVLMLAFLGRIAPFIKDDKTYLSLRYLIRFGKVLNWKNPKTYNEKLQWLKLNFRLPIMTKMVDKVEAKQYVAELIGDEYIIKTLGVWNCFEDINFEILPNRFVLKTTHDSGGVVICKDKANFDKETAKAKLEKSLKHDYFISSREWPYKDVPHRIIAEEYLVDESGYELKDYKWFCFDGDVRALFIATDRGNETEDTKFDFYDSNFKHLPVLNGHPNAKRIIEKPRGFDEMKFLASKLSKGFPHLRVDFYDINGKIFFGELTFFHWSGMKPFEPEEWDYTFGRWIKLPNIPE